MNKFAVDITAPPPPAPPRELAFPHYDAFVLGNGVQAFVYGNHAFPLVSVTAVIRSGSGCNDGIPGLASMTSEMLPKGTPTRTAEAIAFQMEFAGASIVTGSNWDALTVRCSVLSRELRTAMEVLSDVVCNATFPAPELEILRRQRLAGIMQRNASPGALSMMALARGVFGDHPFGYAQDGVLESVERMSRDDLEEFASRHIAPGNVFLVAGGDVSRSAFQELGEEFFGDWSRESRVSAVPELPLPPESTRVIIAPKQDAVQSAIAVGHRGIARSDPDFLPAMVMNTVLGGYFGSRLNLNLREERGYTYGVNSQFDVRRLPGLFFVGAEVRNEVTRDAVEQILVEMRGMREEPVPGDELEGVKHYLAGMFPLQLETPAQVAASIIHRELYGFDLDYYRNYIKNLFAVSAEDVLQSARRFLHPDRAVIAVSGDADYLQKELASFGTVTVREFNE